MKIFLTRGRRKKSDGTYYVFYILRTTYWDSKSKGQKQRYLGYVGTKPVLAEKRARCISKKIGVSLDELRQVKRLKIIPDKS